MAAHPDDEVLGCGGVIARHVSQGDEVHVMIMAEGITSRDNKRNTSTKKQELSDLQSIAVKANAALGVKAVTFCGFPDNRMDSVELLDVVKEIEAVIKKIKPSIVYTHSKKDVNIDHRITHSALVTACRPQPKFCVKSLLFFEVASSTEWPVQESFVPNYFVDISATLEKKLKALKIYDCEMRDWPHPRSVKGVEHLAHWRGCSVGVEAAEAFEVGRLLQ